jgi:hypothetical protein
MPNLLEQEAERLKRKFGPHYYKTIEHNLEFVTKEMSLKRGSVDVSEGLIALSEGLPSLSRSPRRTPTGQTKMRSQKRV